MHLPTAALTLLLASFWAGLSVAQDRGGRPGAFDYYILAMSWSPTWCALEGAARGAEQCNPGADFGWILHGLWPQHEEGWPAFCQSPEPAPSRRQTAAMADIMGSSGLAWHQWKKHGVCSGLSARAYYDAARDAFSAVRRPDLLRQLERPVRLPAQVIEEAFLEANPGWQPDMLTITCRSGRIAEARLCLSRDLEPRVCGADVRRDCRQTDALFDPIP